MEIIHGYQETLQAELSRKKKVNPKFSLRKFASELNLSPAFLSKVMRGEKNLSLSTARSIAERLNFSIEMTNEFCRNAVLRESTDVDSSNFFSSFPLIPKNLEMTKFQAISDWQHFAIRELIETPDFQQDPTWIASRLGVTKSDAESAFSRLVQLGLIRFQNKKWIKADSLLLVQSEGPNLALRNHHLQMITKAKEALVSQDIEIRDITGITIPADPKLIEVARKEISRFRKKMSELLSRSEITEVYQLNIQLFRLTTNSNLKIKNTKKGFQ